MSSVKLDKDGVYRVYKDSGKLSTNLVASEWAKEVETLGAGEIFLNSEEFLSTEVGKIISYFILASSIRNSITIEPR